jgi:hypothetical protein
MASITFTTFLFFIIEIRGGAILCDILKLMFQISSSVYGCMDWQGEFSLCVYEEFKCDEVEVCTL